MLYKAVNEFFATFATFFLKRVFIFGCSCFLRNFAHLSLVHPNTHTLLVMIVLLLFQ